MRVVLNKLSFCCLLAGSTVLYAADAAPSASATPHVRYEVRADRAGRLIRRAIPAAAPVSAAADKKIHEIVQQAAAQYQVDPLLVHAVIAVESNYNSHAVSPVGAQGLMQLMPGTARDLGVRDSFNAEENIRAGVKYLKDLQELYKDDRLALAAYNAGAGAVNKYKAIPPYKETQDYVYKVGRKYGEARHAAKATEIAAAAAALGRNEAMEPEHRRVELFTDSEGRIFLRTR